MAYGKTAQRHTKQQIEAARERRRRLGVTGVEREIVKECWSAKRSLECSTCPNDGKLLLMISDFPKILECGSCGFTFTVADPLRLDATAPFNRRPSPRAPRNF